MIRLQPGFKAANGPFRAIPKTAPVDAAKAEARAVKPSDISSDIVVYPSPSTGIVNITAKALDNAFVEVLDPSGKVVYKTKNTEAGNQLTMNLQTLSNGVYFIKIHTGEKVVTRKVLINK